MPADFDLIAPFYDSLSYLVYGKNLIRAKKAFFNLIPPHSRILLMGGGTGNILNDLLEQRPSVHIDFVEPSENMIRIAQKKLKKKFNSQVTFICGDHHSVPFEIKYDVVTSFFVMDCFEQHEALEFAQVITSHLEEKSLWLFADFFYTGNAFQRLLISFMYWFFKLTANISANKLPEYSLIAGLLNFRCDAEKFFLNGLIRSRVYLRAV